MTIAEALAAWGSYDIDDPFPLFAEVRELGPVHAVTLADGHGAWLVVGYEEAHAALNDPDSRRTCTRPWPTVRESWQKGFPARPSLGTCSPSTRLTTPGSGDSSPRLSRPRRVESCARVCRRSPTTSSTTSPSRTPQPGRPGLNLRLPTAVHGHLRAPGCTRARPGPLGEGFSKMLVPTSTPEEYAAAKEASDSVVAMLKALVEAKRIDPGDDLVADLINARDGEESLDTQELLSTIFQLIVAGHDTTASLIGNSLVALFRNPAELAELRADPSRIPKAVEEFLRFDAPVPHSTFRYTAAAVTLGGVTVPAGEQVIICMAAANRDTDRYAGPESLDLERDEARHLAFGHGVHHCLGAPLARMEGQLALGSLLRTFPGAVTGGSHHRPALGPWRRPRTPWPLRAACYPRPGRLEVAARVEEPGVTDPGDESMARSSTRAGGGGPWISPPSANRPIAGSTSLCTIDSASAPATAARRRLRIGPRG